MRTEQIIELTNKSKGDLVVIRCEWENDLSCDLEMLKNRLNKGYDFTDKFIIGLVKEINDYYEYLRELDLIIKSKGE